MQYRSKIQNLPPVKYTPESSAMKRESPMPTGARNVPLCFSAARRKMVITSCAVKNISMTVSPLASVRGPRKKVPTQALHDRSTSSKCGRYIHGTRECRQNHTRCSHRSQNLRNKNEATAYPSNGTNKSHAQRHCRVEQAARHSEEHPCVDCQTETKPKCNICERASVWHLSDSIILTARA